MIVANRADKCKIDRAMKEWVHQEAPTIVADILERMPPAVRQAMTTLDAMESGTHALVMAIGRTITETLIALPEPPPLGVCRECGHKLRQVDADRPLTILGIFGTYDWARPYGVCPQGHGSAAPQDQVFKRGPGHASPRLAGILGRLGIELPFDQVPDVLEQTLGLVVDGDMVRRVAEQIGSWAETQEQQAIQAADQGSPVSSAPGPSTLLVSLDGAMVHTKRTRDGHRGWHEAKVGVCARFEPKAPSPSAVPDDHRPSYAGTDYCVGFEPQANFLPRLYAHALKMGLEDSSCRQVVLIGDGAHGIWEESAAHLRIAGKTWVEILDFYHASQPIWAVAKAVWSQDDAAQHAWVDKVLHRLRHEGGGILDDVWKALPPLSAAVQEQVSGEQAYFTSHQTRLDYPRYWAEGLPIGSGIIESACKSVLKQRESGSGMRWTESGAQSIATLRAIHRSGGWQDFLDEDPWAQLVPPSRRIAG